MKYLNEKYGLGIEESKEYDTLAGFIIFNYDGIPTAGETVFIGGLQLRILRTTRSRIELASGSRNCRNFYIIIKAFPNNFTTFDC